MLNVKNGWIKAVWGPLRRFAGEWAGDNASLMAAGVAFYTIFSIVPLLSLVVLGASAFFDNGAARASLVDSVAQVATPKTAEAIGAIATNIAGETTSGVTVISAILLIFGASSVFQQLRAALDIVLDVPPSKRPAWLSVLIARVVAIVMVIGIILFLLLSVMTTAALTLARRYAPHLLAGSDFVWRIADAGLSTLLLWMVACVTLRFTPDIRLPWSCIARGAAVTAIVFGGGRYAIAAYLAHADVLSGYGAAGSLFVILLAIYFAVLALFAGAEIAELLARSDEQFTEERARKQGRAGYVSRKPNDPSEEGQSSPSRR